jgi:hypothetical protein
VTPFSIPPQAPQNVPPGTSVDPVAAVWGGISPQVTGQGGLIQTGYFIDTANLLFLPYRLWYSYFPTFGTIPFIFAPAVRPGDLVTMSVFYLLTFFSVWSWYLVWDYDFYQGFGTLAVVTTPSTYNPIYVHSITEAPTPFGSKPSQIAGFSNYPVLGTWYGIQCMNKKWVSADSLYRAGNYNQITLTQAAANLNTGESYLMGYNTDQVTWYNSDYDWNYV